MVKQEGKIACLNSERKGEETRQDRFVFLSCLKANRLPEVIVQNFLTKEFPIFSQPQ